MDFVWLTNLNDSVIIDGMKRTNTMDKDKLWTNYYQQCTENYHITIKYPDGTKGKLYWANVYALIIAIEMMNCPTWIKDIATDIKNEMTKKGKFEDYLAYWIGE